MCTGDVEDMRNDTDTAVQQANKICANILQFKLCCGQLLGSKLGLEYVDVDTVGYDFGVAIGVNDGFCQRC